MHIHPGYLPGCIGRIVELHGTYYSTEAGFGVEFEAKVARELSGFCVAYDPGRDGLWLAVREGRIVGAVVIDGSPATPAGYAAAHSSAPLPSAAHPFAAHPFAAHPSAPLPSAAHPSAAHPSAAHPSAAHPSATDTSEAHFPAADRSAAPLADAPPTGAHLRWFIVSAEARGTGIGRRLLQAAIDFCDERGYPAIWLWTFDRLHAARHLYEAAGFRLAHAQRGAQWGREVNEQLFVRSRDASARHPDADALRAVSRSSR